MIYKIRYLTVKRVVCKIWGVYDGAKLLETYHTVREAIGAAVEISG